MESVFQHIKIVSFDETATHKSDRISVLVLSASAPYEWSNYFNQRWTQHFYMMKRNASVSGMRLEVYCVPDELQNLIPELNKVITETNQAYQQHLAQIQQQAAQQAAADVVEREKLAQIKSSLKFD